MAEIEIKNLSDVLREHINSTKTIKSVEIRKLPQAGYGSIMAKVAITLKGKEDSEEKLYTVAKLLPSDGYVRQLFQIEFTYKNEVAFYNTVLPTLIHFQKEKGVTPLLNMFAKFYGARLSLQKNEVDEDAVLILEDLSVAGMYEYTDKHDLLPQILFFDISEMYMTLINLKQDTISSVLIEPKNLS